MTLIKLDGMHVPKAVILEIRQQPETYQLACKNEFGQSDFSGKDLALEIKETLSLWWVVIVANFKAY